MRNLTFDDLRLGLKDLTETHADALDASITGKLYRPLILAKRKEIESLPEGVLRGLPYATELAEADAAHDAMGTAIHHFTQSILVHPAIEESTKETAHEAQKTFAPALSIFQARYADEAAFAQRKRPAFESMRPALSRIQTPGGGDLAMWIAFFLDKGDEIGKLLHGRAEAGVGVGASAAGGALRSSAIGLLGRFRQAIRDEVASGAALPKDYEERLFAFIDQLDRTRGEASKRRVGAKSREPDASAMPPPTAPEAPPISSEATPEVTPTCD